jgi:bifunctional non-homologous end joining protein LigD
MGLRRYSSKRKLDITPEPKAKIKKSEENLIFVIQKHDASHLHFDLRLECDGVLKSFAVPKGPPLSPKEKRLAIMVEDHPYDYKDFEGTIPEGHYGAGEVEIWDKGYYSIAGISNLKEAQDYLRAGLKKGHFSFILHGKKLKSAYTLIKTALPGAKESWLWFLKSSHHNDEMPKVISPMLASEVDKPFDHKDWIFELKLDGYRALARIEHNEVSLISRNNKLFNDLFSIIVKDLKKYINHDLILDGEIVILDKKGKSHFQLLQNYNASQAEFLFYYVFDILYIDGQDLRSYALIERKALLEQLLAPLIHSHIRYSDHIEEKGIKLFKQAQKLGLEGLIAKNSHSIYVMKRSKEWLKIKTHKRQELVIGGFTAPRGNRKQFGALLVGYYDNNILHYAGHVGTGFSEQSIEELSKKLRALVQKKCPFEKVPVTNSPATFVKPILVCEVSFSEWTHDGLMRHPVFAGLRIDKKAQEITR